MLVIFKKIIMKNLLYMFTAALVFAMVVFSSCGKDDEVKLTPEQEQAKALAGSWSQSSSDNIPTGVDPTVLDGLTLSFSSDADFKPTSFSASGAPDFFSTSGSTWSFGGSASVINLTNVTPVESLTVIEVTENSLKISFTHPGLRVAGLDGSYTVSLSK